MKKKVFLFGMLGVWVWGGCLGLSLPVWAVGEISEEELLFRKIPSVITASRYEQPINESPSSISVVTAEDIRRSGAVTIPDALRMVSGLDLLTITLTDQNIGIRGFNGHMNNTVLVMIDGRSVNEDMYGFVLWETLPIELTDIERIEVIRGPGSALYGANALTGVVNIITKSPAEAEGTLISLRGGNFNTRIGSILHGGKKDKIEYKVSIGGNSADEWRETKGKAGKVFRGNGLVSYKINDDSSLSLSAGRSGLENTRITSFTDFGVMKKNGLVSYLKADYERPNLSAKIWWKQFYGQNRFEIDPKDVFWDTKTLDAEMQHNLFVGEKNKFIWGLNCRRNRINKNEYLNPEDQFLYSLFMQDELKAMDKLSFFAGGRLDHHPITKYNFSPRGSALYSFDDHNILRVSAGTSYRNPSQIESYMNKTFDVPIPGTPLSFTMSGLGGKELEAAKIESYEAAYQTELGKKLKLNFNLFYNKLYNIIGYGTTQYYAENELFPGSPGGILPKAQSFYNFGKVDGYGGETGMDMLILPWLRGLLNYSYQIYTNRVDEPTTLLKDEKNTKNEQIPLHKINCGLDMKLNKIRANLIANYVSENSWIRTLAGEERREKVNGYIQLNGRIGYRVFEGAEAAVSVFNILENKHNEFPLGWGPTYPISDEIGRRITLDISYKF
ncbi:MAG: TonB-dependent receptor [Elusimicrobiota bacterium]